ncbi:MAG: hypothetical protein ACERKV_14520, partial [Clostridiaceae bacterium]
MDEDISVMTLDGTINLGTDIYNSIQNIFYRTELTPEKKAIQIQISTSQKEPIRVKAVWQADEGEKTISQLPLHIDFTKGEGILNRKVSTDQFGYATSQLSKVTSKQKLQEITVSLDLSSILDENNENYELNKLFFTPESAPKSKILLNVERLKA